MTTPRNYPPTPWIAVIHPLNARAYKFRLSRTRRHGRIYVQFHKECPSAPNQQRGVLPSRPRWYDWVQAAQRLLATAQYAPHTKANPAHPIVEWNKNMKDYVATHGDDVNIVAFALPNLLDPSLGPSYKTQRITALAQPGASTSVTHVRARNNRYAEIVITMRDVLTRIRPLHERMQDARRMKGYNKTEVDQMLDHLALIKATAELLYRQAQTNTFVAPVDTATPLPTTAALNATLTMQQRSERAAARVQASPINFHVDDDLPELQGNPLSPQERAIAQEQEFVGQVQDAPWVANPLLRPQWRDQLTPEQRTAPAAGGPLDVPPDQWHLWVKNERGFWIERESAEPEIQVQSLSLPPAKPKGFGIVVEP